MDDFLVVEPVFRRIFATVSSRNEEDADALTNLTEDERAIYVTRILEGELDNGGWYQVFGNGVGHQLEAAVTGYERLGLPDYAALIRAVRDAGFSEQSPEALGERLDAAYFELTGSESSRAELIIARDLSA